MYIESWHGTLKVQHLGNRRRQRVDLLLYILFEEAMPALRKRDLKLKLEVNHRSRTHAEQLRYNAAHQLPIHKAQAMVEPDIDLPGCLLVLSFSSEKLYRVKLQAELISSWNCSDHTTTGLPCKHMYLVERVLPFTLSFSDTAVAAQIGLGRVTALVSNSLDQQAAERHSQVVQAIDEGQIDFLRQWLAHFNTLDVVERNNAKMRETAVAIGQKLQDIVHLAQNAGKSYSAKQR